MLGNLTRRRILKGREEAVTERRTAARDFVAAIREAEAALDAFRAANDKLYRSDVQGEQVALSDLRRGRERTFAFQAAREVVAEAPVLARALGVRVAAIQSLPFIDWVEVTSKDDLAAINPKGG